jgi:PA14 domain/FlgD Ig-like domain
MKQLLTLLLLTAGITPAADIPFTLEKPGNVSAAIYDAQGRMVRELARAEPIAVGKHSFAWDGLDMGGKPAPAGKYQWRTLQTQGLRSEYLMSIGTSVGDRWWPGNHAGPTAVAVADDSLVVAAHSEGPPLLTRVGFDGRVIWERAAFEPARNPYDVAVGGGKAFYLQDNGKVFVLDFGTGKPVGKGQYGTTLSAMVPVKAFVFGTGQSEVEGTVVPLNAVDPHTGTGWNNVDGMKQGPNGITCDALEPRVFEAPLPNGEYLLRYHYGDDIQATTLVEVQPNGMEAPRGHYTLADKMAWWQLPGAPVGAKAEPLFLPQIYQLPRGVAVKDGRLSIKFIPGSPRAKPKSAHWGLRKIEVIAMADRIAADDATLLLSCSGAGLLLWLDPVTGNTLDTMPLANVRDIALGLDHEVFALIGENVVRFSREGKKPVTHVSGLREPVALDVDVKTGVIVVAEGGSVQQVKSFDAAGRITATHGRAGGRKLGRYEPRNFSSLRGVASDGHGGFVVIEQNTVPRRTARLDASGEPLKEWFGGMDFYTQTALDPSDPSVGWLRQDDETVVQVKLDYDKREWHPLAAYRWTELFDPNGASNRDSLYATRQSYPPWFAGRVPSFNRMRTLRRDIDGDGKPELLLEFTSLPLLLVHDEKQDRLRPLACLGLMHRDLWAAGNAPTVDQLPPAWVEAIRLAGGDPADASKRIKYAHYSWADENGDGLIDANELRLGEAHRDAGSATQPNGGFCLRVDSALNAWIGGGNTDKSGMYRLFKPERITACGAPVWPLQGQVGPVTERSGESKSLVPTSDGGAFLLLGGNGDGTKSSSTYGTAVHGWGWPSTMTDGMALLRLDAAGNRVWRSASKAARWPHPRGQLQGAWHLGRELKGCVPVFDWLEQPCEFWTADGLYVGGLFDGRDPYDGHDLSQPGSMPDRLYTWHGVNGKRIGRNNYDQHSPLAADDFRTGGEVAELPDGSVVFLGQGANNNPCYRITGWDNFVRQHGEVTISQPVAEPSQTGAGLKAEVYSNLDFNGNPVVSRTDERLWFGMNKPWPEGTPARDFSIRWTGFLEPRFSENYCLSVYARGEFKLWIDGKDVAWADQDYPREREVRKGHSLPIPLQSGKRVPIRIEYRAASTDPKSPMPSASFHLNWESLSQPAEHVPTAALLLP